MKYIIITRRHLMLCTAVLFTVIAVAIGSFSIFAGEDRHLPIYCVETDKKEIAISFDAAWGADSTGKLLDILKEYDVPSTFFVVGAWVDKYPEAVKMIHDAGHQVQNHSNTHPYMTQLSTEQIKNEIETCNRKIENITGIRPTLLRPPYGDYNNSVIDAVYSLDMYPIQWSVDSLDWKENSTADSIYSRVVNKVKPGSIVLFHNDAKYTPEALPKILSKLKAEGYKFVFISDLIYKDNYKINHEGMQIPERE